MPGKMQEPIRVTVRDHYLGDKESVARGVRLWAKLLLRHAKAEGYEAKAKDDQENGRGE